MTLDLAAIEKRLNAATRQLPLPMESQDEIGDYFDCPLCEGEGSIQGCQWDYHTLAAGVTVHGIGDDLTNLERFVKAAPVDIAALIAEVKRLQEGLEAAKLHIYALRDQGWGCCYCGPGVPNGCEPCQSVRRTESAWLKAVRNET